MPNPLYDTLFGIHAGKTAPFLNLEGGGVLTYREFLEMAARIANAMMNMGLQPGDRVAAQTAKSPQALALYAACVRSGLVFLPLNTAYTVAELAYFLEDSGATLVVCGDENASALADVAARSGGRIETLNADGDGSLMQRANDQPNDCETVPRAEDDLAALLYTSGTTGRAKGAMLTQTNLLSNALTLTEVWRFTDRDILLHALPIFHTHGLFVAVHITLVAGGGMIFLPNFDLDQIIARLPEATTMMGVPTFYTRLLDDPRLTRELTAHMRLFVSGSAPLLADTHHRFEQRTGHRILERYGLTETNMNTSNPYDGERRAGTVGFPLPDVELKITSPDTGKPVTSGEVGQIEVRGPNVFKGYWQMPDKTAAEMREDGFFVTGDLGSIDADGYLHIVGRDKDLIISGGYNIYPKEIELLLDEQPGVLESAVIGVPHPDFGETVLGILVPESGQSPNPAHIMQTLQQTLAKFKHPRKLILLDELPRNTMGKVQKNILRERYQAAFSKA